MPEACRSRRGEHFTLHVKLPPIMTSITGLWDEQELASLGASYDLGSAPGDAVSKYNPTPGALGECRSLGAHGSRLATYRLIWGRAPCSKHDKACLHSLALQAAAELGSLQCRPTTTHFMARRRSMCQSCRQTAASSPVGGWAGGYVCGMALPLQGPVPLLAEALLVAAWWRSQPARLLTWPFLPVLPWSRVEADVLSHA